MEEQFGMASAVRPSPPDTPPPPPLRKRSFSQPDSIGHALQKRNSKTPISTPFVVANTNGQIPDERYGHSACVDAESEGGEGIMYIFGGCNSNQKFFSDELFSLHLRTREWKQIVKPALPPSNDEEEENKPISKVPWPQGRHFHSVCVYRNCMIICGGKSNGYRNDLHSFNFTVSTETREWSEIIPQGEERISRRYGHSAVIYNDSMYVFGGYDDFGLTCNDLWEFSFNSNEWHKVKTLGTPPERYHHSAVVFEGSLYVFGGFQGYDDLFEYRFGSRTWSLVNTKGAPPNPRWGHRAIVVKRHMYILGGCDLVINYNDLHRFHFDTGRWEKLPGGGYLQGYFQTAVEHNDRIYIFGGKNVHNYNFNDLFEYRLDIEVKANPNTFEEDFRNMLYDNDFTDVIFSFPNEGRHIKAHKHILFARCSRFRDFIPSTVGRFSNQIQTSTNEPVTKQNSPTRTRRKRSRSRPSSPAPSKSEKSNSSSRRRKRKSRSRKKLAERTSGEGDDLHSEKEERESRSTTKESRSKRSETKKEEEEEIDVWEEPEAFVVSITDTKYDIYRRFLEYIYSGYFEMSQPYAFELLPLAATYGLEHLKTMCAVKIQFMITIDNVLEALSLADSCKADDLKSFCLSFIAEHREQVTPALRKGQAGLHPDLLKEVKKWLTVQGLEKLQSNTTPIYQTILT